MTTPLSLADRHALGVRARKQLARSAHAAFDHKACPQNPLEVLAASERGRLPRLITIKHERMAASPFGFFRGAVPIMAADLACHPNTGITTQLCGDAHVLNLGAYAGFDGRLVFDINDFDETIHGPFEWDVKRLATSLLLAGRAAGVRRTGRRKAVATFLARYRRSMREFAVMPVLELARYQIHRLTEVGPVATILKTAERSTPAKSLLKLTEPGTKPAQPGTKSTEHTAKRTEASLKLTEPATSAQTLRCSPASPAKRLTSSSLHSAPTRAPFCQSADTSSPSTVR